MLRKPGPTRANLFPRILVSILWGLYILAFGLFYPSIGLDIISLAIFPIIGAGWYLGFGVSIFVAALTIITNLILLFLYKQPVLVTMTNPINLFSNLALMVTAAIVGRIGSIARERGDALARLKESEEDRQNYTQFLEFLNEIIRSALEVRDLASAHKVLLEQIARLFKADGGFLALWDEANNTPIPMAAFGSMKIPSPRTRPEEGGLALAATLIKSGQPLAITDLENSPYINPNIGLLFPTHSVLGLPLIVRDRNLAVLYLGYNERRSFDQREIAHAEIAAQQIALVLTKIQLLEDMQKRVKQLTVLHEVALASTQVDTIDQLIASATEIIGKNLFSDNFGILLMDEDRGVLRLQPSYRFVPTKEPYPAEISLGQGITGQVARNGQPIRTGNVDGFQNYLDVDNRTSSELCVPIKLKDKVLGVINAESTRIDAFSPEDEFLLGTLADQLATAIEKLRAAEGERRWLNQLAHSNDLIYSLAHVTTHIEKALSADEIIQVLAEELRKIELTCLMAVYDDSRELFTVNYNSLEPEIREQLENDIESSLIIHSFSLDTLKSTLKTEDIFDPATPSDPGNEIQILFASKRQREKINIPWESGFEIEDELIRLPLVVEENLLGILWVWGKSITRADLPVMSIFAKQIGISLERARLFQEVQDLALTDSLTSLNNRRSLFEVGRIEYLRAGRLNRPFSCLMLDIDHFKQINDTYGHQTGDTILREFAKRCRDSIREIDLIGRYGGEELIILMPETEIEVATQVAERLRMAVSEHPMIVADWISLDVTVSIGVGTKDENTLDLETLIARADQAMYIAKHRGRNRVAVSK